MANIGGRCTVAPYFRHDLRTFRAFLVRSWRRETVMTRTILAGFLAISMACGLAACGDRPSTRAVTGGLIGAGGGAAVGSLAGGHAGTGALIGGAAGAATGALTSPR